MAHKETLYPISTSCRFFGHISLQAQRSEFPISITSCDAAIGIIRTNASSHIPMMHLQEWERVCHRRERSGSTMAKYLSKEIVTRVKQLTPTDTAEKKQWYQVGSRPLETKSLQALLVSKCQTQGLIIKKKNSQRKGQKTPTLYISFTLVVLFKNSIY